mgnify:CR=1 FL=1
MYLNNQISQYDNLIDYSTVTITYNQTEVEEGFFAGYGEYLVGLIKLVFYLFMYTLPFTLLAGAIILTIFLIKKRKTRKNNQE